MGDLVGGDEDGDLISASLVQSVGIHAGLVRSLEEISEKILDGNRIQLGLAAGLAKGGEGKNGLGDGVEVSSTILPFGPRLRLD